MSVHFPSGEDITVRGVVYGGVLTALALTTFGCATGEHPKLNPSNAGATGAVIDSITGDGFWNPGGIVLGKPTKTTTVTVTKKGKVSGKADAAAVLPAGTTITGSRVGGTGCAPQHKSLDGQSITIRVTQDIGGKAEGSRKEDAIDAIKDKNGLVVISETETKTEVDGEVEYHPGRIPADFTEKTIGHGAHVAAEALGAWLLDVGDWNITTYGGEGGSSSAKTGDTKVITNTDVTTRTTQIEKTDIDVTTIDASRTKNIAGSSAGAAALITPDP